MAGKLVNCRKWSQKCKPCSWSYLFSKTHLSRSPHHPMGKLKNLLKKKHSASENAPPNLVFQQRENFSEDDVEIIFNSLLGPNNLDIPAEDFSKLSNLSKDEKLKLIEKYNQISHQQANVFVSKDQIKNLITSGGSKSDKKNKKKNFLTVNRSSKCELQLSSEQFVFELQFLVEKLKAPLIMNQPINDSFKKPNKRNRSISHNSSMHNQPDLNKSFTLTDKINELKSIELVTSLRVTLSSQAVRWLLEFIHFGGIQSLIALLEVTNYETQSTPSPTSPSSIQQRFQFECVKCIKKCMDHHVHLPLLFLFI